MVKFQEVKVIAAAGMAGSIFVTTSAFAANTTTVPAQTQAVVQTQNGVGYGRNADGPNYIDSDKDGVCDFYADGSMMRRGGGVGGTGAGSEDIVDSDGDGVCDNYGLQGTGAGPDAENFVDSDSDGTCDNYETRTPLQDGSGRTGTQRGVGRGK